MNTENIAEKFTAKTVEGKTVIVTGAANGIGRAEAELLALSGANVVFTDLDDSKGQEAIKPFGKKAVYFHHDVTKPSDWKNVLEQTIKLFGRIDGLVNNAGIYLPGSIEEVTEETLERQISVNQKGTFWGIQYAAEAMKKRVVPSSTLLLYVASGVWQAVLYTIPPNGLSEVLPKQLQVNWGNIKSGLTQYCLDL